MSRRFERPQGAILAGRLRERRRFIQVVAGPRQCGKTTLVQQVAGRIRGDVRFATADEPTLRGRDWLEQQWEAARLSIRGVRRGTLLVLDEVQKIPGWSETVKRLWDEDTRARRSLRVVLLGSAPLLIEPGLTESLAGRFEMLRLPHWSYSEMKAAFGFKIDRFVFHGGYPGAAPLASDPARWSAYVLDSLIETTLSRDVLLLSRIDKPALLRRLFHVASAYSGQIVSYTKILGQLQDAGNVTTLAHYLDLLAGAGMVTGLQKFSGSVIRRRGSIPKLLVLNTALMNAPTGLSFEETRGDTERWGRVVESAVGAHLAAAGTDAGFDLCYWRERHHEVDFVVRSAKRLTAIEVKTGRRRDSLPGMAAFSENFGPARKLLVGGDGIPLEEFLSKPVRHWIGA